MKVLTFNSTMVRLKASVGVYGQYIRTDFQFHYGTIKSVICIFSVITWSSFNSTMVRLKGNQVRWCDQNPFFQFHYGTIKRYRRKLLTT